MAPNNARPRFRRCFPSGFATCANEAGREPTVGWSGCSGLIGPPRRSCVSMLALSRGRVKSRRQTLLPGHTAAHAFSHIAITVQVQKRCLGCGYLFDPFRPYATLMPGCVACAGTRRSAPPRSQNGAIWTLRSPRSWLPPPLRRRSYRRHVDNPALERLFVVDEDGAILWPQSAHGDPVQDRQLVKSSQRWIVTALIPRMLSGPPSTWPYGIGRLVQSVLAAAVAR
jgi:hypothetical protein